MSIKVDHKISCDYRFISTSSIINDFIENYRKKKKGIRRVARNIGQPDYCLQCVSLTAQYWMVKTKRNYYSSYLPTKKTN